MDNTIIQQGRFTSDGTNTFIPLISGVDWMAVYNITQAAANQTAAVGVKYYWQAGFPQNSKWTTFKSNAAAAANLEQYLTTNGFQIQDESLEPAGVLHSTVTAVSAANPPVVTVSANHNLVAGNVVRMYSCTGAEQLGGIDFTVGNSTLTNTTFSLDYMNPIAVAAAPAGAWAKISYNPIFYPPHRFITDITQAAQAVVTLSVTHRYFIGQTIRMVVPAGYGMTQMNGLLATIVDIDTDVTDNTITLDIDSTAFTAFAFPLTAAVPFSPAMTVPVGENTAEALSQGVDILSDATTNIAEYGMLLVGGAGNPGGADNDVMYWVAGKSFSVDNN